MISHLSRKLANNKLQRGLRSAQPAASAAAGVFYHVTDENVVEYSDGSVWKDATEVVVAGPHKLLDGSMHVDSAAQTATRGSLIYGNSTPAWDELVIGAANRVLRSDGTDLSWAQVNVSTDVTGDLALANLAPSSAASRLLGRGSASAGDWQELTVGAGLTISGTELSVTASGAGDVLGPASSTDNAVVRFDGTTGKAVQNSGVTIDDSNNISTAGTITAGSYTNHLGAFAATTSAQLAGVINDETGSGALVFGTKPTITFANTGLTVRDTADDNVLTIAPGSNFSVNRTLTITTGDADRTLTLNGSPTLGDWFDQTVKVAASPAFAGITINGHVFTVNGAPTLNNWFDQNVKTTASPTFANVNITATGNVYLDGGGDSYIQESSANRVDHVVGGSISLRLTATSVQCNGPITFINPINASFSGTQNDYAPSGWAATNLVHLTGSSTPVITGFAAGADGELKLLINVGATSVVLNHESGSSTSTNRIVHNGGLSLTLSQYESVFICYSGNLSRWVVITPA